MSLSINSDDYPELFFALVGPVGTDLNKIQNILVAELKKVDYSTTEIKLSKLIASTSVGKDIKTSPPEFEDDRINQFMDAGDSFRKLKIDGNSVVRLGISTILSNRPKLGGRQQLIPQKAYILNSLKHPSEVATLRSLYGDALFIISVYEPKIKRKENLAKSIMNSRKERDHKQYYDSAIKLIERDEKEADNKLGQNVHDTFPMGDIFIDAARKDEDLNNQINRFIELLFGNPFITPTTDEHGMYHAFSIALRSSDLSRQVGALITSQEGEFLVSGCNEVPKSGGNSIWEGPKYNIEIDYRDFREGFDSNARIKDEIFNEIFERLKSHGWLSEDKQSLSDKELTKLALMKEASSSEKAGPLYGVRASSLLEFGRMVHAEMSAITEAARRGISIKGMQLYCTTFPCHMCARHIIASGINKIVYIEPYPKSMTKELYKKTVNVDHDNEHDSDAVVFYSFVGISPSRYMHFFKMKNKRKDSNGSVLEWTQRNAKPIILPSREYISAENGHVADLGDSK